MGQRGEREGWDIWSYEKLLMSYYGFFQKFKFNCSFFYHFSYSFLRNKYSKRFNSSNSFYDEIQTTQSLTPVPSSWDQSSILSSSAITACNMLSPSSPISTRTSNPSDRTP